MSKEYASSRQIVDWNNDWCGYRKLRIRLVHLLCQLNFLVRCKRTGVIPQAFQLRKPALKNRCRGVLQRASITLLSTAIRDLRATIGNNELGCYVQYQSLAARTHPILVDTFNIRIHNSANSVKNQENERLDKKYKFLKKNKETSKATTKLSTTPSTRYVNISNIPIPENVDKLLAKGPKYSPPTHLNLKLTIASTESAIHNTKAIDQPILRAKAAMAITDYKKPPAIKYTSQQLKDIGKFVKNHNLAICKADKVGCPVLLEKTELDQKVSEFLKSTHCQELNKSTTENLKNAVHRLAKIKILQEFLGKFSVPSYYRTPRLFLQIKLHKSGYPIRPLVENTFSPAAPLEKKLVEKCKFVTDNHPYSIKSTKDFISRLPAIVEPHEMLFTLDVNSLFPSIPYFDAYMLLVKSLMDRVSLPGELIRGLYDCFYTLDENSCFVYNQKFYHQQSGVPMGSPLSPLLAEIYMQHIENTIIENYHYKPKLWLCYVDDIFIIWPHHINELTALTNHITSKFTSISFTQNKETNNSINFLDVLITREYNNKLNTSVYRKPYTQTNIIPYNSHTTGNYKLAAFKAFIHRANTICNTEETLKKEYDIIKSIAHTHQFPEDTVPKLITKYVNKNKIRNLISNKEKLNYVGNIPYYPTVSYKIQNIFKKSGYHIAINSSPNILKIIVQDRDKIDPLDSPGVYSIPIDTGSGKTFYIGSTYRSIKTRLEEHKNDVFQGNCKTAIAILTTEDKQAIPDWKNTRKIGQFTNKFSLRYLESIEILLSKNNCNSEIPFNVPMIWQSVLRTNSDL